MKMVSKDKVSEIIDENLDKMMKGKVSKTEVTYAIVEDIVRQDKRFGKVTRDGSEISFEPSEEMIEKYGKEEAHKKCEKKIEKYSEKLNGAMMLTNAFGL